MLSCPHFIGTVLDLFANDDENLSYCHIRYTTLKKSVGISNALQASVCGKCNRYLIKIAFFSFEKAINNSPIFTALYVLRKSYSQTPQVVHSNSSCP